MKAGADKQELQLAEGKYALLSLARYARYIGFLCLGIFMYALAVCGAVRLIVIAVRKLKKSK